MVHRCTVQRDASVGAGGDPWGNDQAPAWSDHLVDLPCRFWFEEGRTIKDGDQQIELTKRKLVVPDFTDITEDDRVFNVRDRRGRELADGPMRVDSVGRRDGHLVAWLVDVR